LNRKLLFDGAGMLELHRPILFKKEIKVHGLLAPTLFLHAEELQKTYDLYTQHYSKR
jgi:hypothetical protein